MRIHVVFMDPIYVCLFLSIGTPKIYTTTGFGPRKNREMAGMDHLVVYMQTAVKYNTFYLHHPGVVYIQTAVFFSSLHIHHQIVNTSHLPIFSRPKPCGGVYLWGPNSYFGHAPSCFIQYLCTSPHVKAQV